MTWFPGWVPLDWEGRAIVLVGAALLFAALFVWTAANLKIVLCGDWLAGALLQAGGLVAIASVLCGRHIVNLFQGDLWVGYRWLGRKWFHWNFFVYPEDAVGWAAAALALTVAAVGLATLGRGRGAS